MIVIAAGYSAAFTREPDLDPADITRELAFFVAVVVVAWFGRHDIPRLNVGFALLLTSLWMEVVDEFTFEPRWMGTGVPSPIGMLGLILMSFGVREAARRRTAEVALRREAESALQKSLGTLRAVVEETPDPMWVKDLDQRYVLVNAAFARLVGRASDAVVGRRETDVLPPDAADRAQRADARALMSGRPVEVEETLELAGKPRTYLVSKSVFHDDDGNAIGILGVARDISDRKAVEDRLAHQAHHDVVTGLPNRAAFLDRLERHLGRYRRDPSKVFAVLFVDVDRFKEINDRYGHAAGDEVLLALARHLEHWVRPGDVVARFGGDEFTVILQEVTQPEDAVHVAQRVREGLSAPLRLSTADITVTVSIGVALAADSHVQGGDVLRDADAAMYRAKNAGGARHVVHAS